MKKQKATQRQKKPPFQLEEPNDDIGAFGWDLSRLRYPSESSTKNDIWPGRHMFEVPDAKDYRRGYGFDIYFASAKFIQIRLDNSKEINLAADKVRKSNYSAESIEHMRKEIMRVYREEIVPEIDTHFERISSEVAKFYAARLAHLETFGRESDYIEASTTKSRR